MASTVGFEAVRSKPGDIFSTCINRIITDGADTSPGGFGGCATAHVKIPWAVCVEVGIGFGIGTKTKPLFDHRR